MSKIIDIPENEFNNLIPDWAKNINDFLIDKKSCNDCSSCNLYNNALDYCKKKKWEFFICD